MELIKLVLKLPSPGRCPPCRSFTPVLSQVYQGVKKQHEDDFEVVFVSRDSDEAQFKQYLSTMPWLAVPFTDSSTRNMLCAKYQVRGIPTLVILGPEGEVIAKNAVGVIRKGPACVAEYPWTGAGENNSEG